MGQASSETFHFPPQAQIHHYLSVAPCLRTVHLFGLLKIHQYILSALHCLKETHLTELQRVDQVGYCGIKEGTSPFQRALHFLPRPHPPHPQKKRKKGNKKENLSKYHSVKVVPHVILILQSDILQQLLPNNAIKSPLFFILCFDAIFDFLLSHEYASHLGAQRSIPFFHILVMEVETPILCLFRWSGHPKHKKHFIVCATLCRFMSFAL